jgi:hypothetical protein
MLLIRTWDAPNILADQYFISASDINPNDYATIPTPYLQSLAPPLYIFYTLFMRTPDDGMVSLRNPSIVILYGHMGELAIRFFASTFEQSL